MGLGTLRLLEAIRILGLEQHDPVLPGEHLRAVRQPPPPPQHETTPFQPRSPYATAKLYAYWITRNYREGYGLFAANGILFNHESPLRGETFVTRKITRAVAAIELGLQDRLCLGNLDARRDWGHARDYVEGMWRILQHDRRRLGAGHRRSPLRARVRRARLRRDRPRDRLAGRRASTSRASTREPARLLVEIDPRYFRPLEVDYLLGDPSRAQAELGWRPTHRVHRSGRARWSRPTWISCSVSICQRPAGAACGGIVASGIGLDPGSLRQRCLSPGIAAWSAPRWSDGFARSRSYCSPPSGPISISPVEAAVAAWLHARRPDIVMLAAAKVGGILANACFPVEFLQTIF